MTQAVAVTIKAPNLQVAEFTIEGTAPYVQHKFSQKARSAIMAKHEAGSKANKSKTREARNFDEDFKQAMYFSADGWNGIPAPSFRNAMISACRLVGFKMTHAKLSVFAIADGFDEESGKPLIRITKGDPVKHVDYVRNETGVCDIRSRPMWREGWQAKVRIRFDADMFSTQDVANLLLRAGMQVGVGEGRPDSRESAGIGWGTFRILEENEHA